MFHAENPFRKVYTIIIDNNQLDYKQFHKYTSALGFPEPVYD